MALATGKTAVLSMLSVIGVLALLFGSILVYEYSESGVQYKVYLDDYNSHEDRIYGQITIKIKNTNDFDILVKNIHADLYNPDTGDLFFEFFHIGGTIEAGETYSESFEYDANIDDIPETEIMVKLSAYVKWGSDIGKTVEHEFIVEIKF